MADDQIDVIIEPSTHSPSHNKDVRGSASFISPSEIKDPYAVDDTASLDAEKARTLSWSELSPKEKAVRTLTAVVKITAIFTLLYLFVCSLDLLSVGLKILAGKEPTKWVRDNAFIQNPVIGLMVGILFTLVVQSSSTTTSTVVSLVSAKFMSVSVAIPIVMGANIGTSVTNTIVAMLQVDDRDHFRRAFAAATIHDMFNWLTTLVLLPFEYLTGYLTKTSAFLVGDVRQREADEKANAGKKAPKYLKAVTEPLTNLIIKYSSGKAEIGKKGTLFEGSTLSDNTIGTITVVGSFVVLLTCLFCIVKLLKSILKGRMAVWIRKTSNSNLPYCPCLTEYLLILMGTGLTFLVQSSSVFTSTLPPLVSVKAISLERAYPLTLGANLGTTTTAIIAALTAEKNIAEALQIALCHFLFNITGVLLFFPLPFTRFPIPMAKALGNTTAQYRWFAIVYVVVLFVLLPLLFMGLAFAGSVYVIVVASIMILCILYITIINWLRNYPRFLPVILADWDFLPEWMRSLEPYDRMFSKCACCVKLKRMSRSTPMIVAEGQEGDEEDEGNEEEKDMAAGEGEISSSKQIATNEIDSEEEVN